MDSIMDPKLSKMTGSDRTVSLLADTHNSRMLVVSSYNYPIRPSLQVCKSV